MTAIPFDKLIMVFSRVWDEMFRRTGEKLKTKEPNTISPDETNHVISFPVPFEELPGKHGRGRAVRRKGGEPRFLVAVLHELAQEDILSYFDVRPPSGSSPNDPRTTIDPALAATADAVLLADFSHHEREVLEDLRNGLRRLGLEEIRALGTHENFEKTASDIEREFRYMRPHLEKIEAYLSSGSPFEQLALEVFEYADEACRKSEYNRGAYDFARDTLGKELTNAAVSDAFRHCQQPASKIWDNPGMKDLMHRSRLARIRAEYLKELGRWSTETDRPRRGKPMVNMSKIVQELERAGHGKLPTTRDQIFSKGSAVILPAARLKILDLIGRLKAS